MHIFVIGKQCKDIIYYTPILIKRFIDPFGEKSIASLLVDRECVGS